VTAVGVYATFTVPAGRDAGPEIDNDVATASE
jgi:hypothetical protein